MAGFSLRPEDVLESPLSFELVSDPGWWEEARRVLGDSELSLAEPFELHLEAYRIGARLLVRGHLRGAIELVCGRCTSVFRRIFEEPVELLLEPASRTQELPESGIALDPEDLQLGHYGGDELDFGPIILEILALEWPMQPLCSKSCLGLCPVCGRNRNKEGCTCETGEKNRPFAGLDKLLERSRSKGR